MLPLVQMNINQGEKKKKLCSMEFYPDFLQFHWFWFSCRVQIIQAWFYTNSKISENTFVLLVLVMIFWDAQNGTKRLHIFKIPFLFLWPAAYLQHISSLSYTGCIVGNCWKLCTTATTPLKQSSSLYNYLSLCCCRTQVKCQCVPDTIKITRILQPFFLHRNTGFGH